MAHIVDHLNVEELGARYRASQDACLARHYQAIWLLAQGRRLAEVAATTGFAQRWLEQLARRYTQGLRLIYLPPYTPELQPTEHLWRLIDEPIVNRHVDRLAEIQLGIEQRCRDLEADPDTLRANTLFRWWPQRPKPI